jgi:hypothetical protein
MTFYNVTVYFINHREDREKSPQITLIFANVPFYFYFFFFVTIQWRGRGNEAK